MNTPRHLLGYERLVSNSESSHYRNSTFLSLFIMVQPPLHPPEPIKVIIFNSYLFIYILIIIIMKLSHVNI